MKIKKNDKVQILSGKDQGKTGKVLQVLPKSDRLSVEGLNILIKHLRPRRKEEKGQRVEFPAFIKTSKVALLCPECGRQTKVAYRLVKKDGQAEKKYRACKKCQAAFD